MKCRGGVERNALGGEVHNPPPVRLAAGGGWGESRFSHQGSWGSKKWEAGVGCTTFCISTEDQNNFYSCKFSWKYRPWGLEKKCVFLCKTSQAAWLGAIWQFLQQESCGSSSCAPSSCSSSTGGGAGSVVPPWVILQPGCVPPRRGSPPQLSLQGASCSPAKVHGLNSAAQLGTAGIHKAPREVWYI